MLRTSLLMAALVSVFSLVSLSLPAAAAPPIDALTSSFIAKAPAKKGKGKEKDKGGDKGVEKPSGLPSDPRSNGSSSAADNGMASEVRRGMSRIEFDDRLIQGQTNKANAIYLFERRESALRSLLKKRTHFHEEIDETLE